MSQHDAINVTCRKLRDGRVTVTVKFIGWTPKDMNSIGYAMESANTVMVVVRGIGVRIRNAVIGAFQ